MDAGRTTSEPGNRTQQLYAAINDLLRKELHHAGAINVQISWDTPGAGHSTLAVPAPVVSTVKPLVRRQLVILNKLAQSPKPLTRKEIAGKGKRIEGSWGRLVKDLLSRKLIFERDGLLSDTQEKLETKD